jgi:hypothetical protein
VIAQDSGSRADASALANALARLEAEHGDTVSAFDHLILAIRNFHNAGDTTTIRVPMASLAVLFDRLGRYEPAATFAGFALSHFSAAGFPKSLARPRARQCQLEKRDRVTIDSIRNHTVRHFPVQQVARATYREIPERRANENNVDFIEGVATAITPLAFLETVMVKGFQTLVDERTTVSYRDGMEAALKLAEELRKDAGDYDKVHILAEMGRVIDAVKEFVPREKWPELQASCGGRLLSDSNSVLFRTEIRLQE